METILVTGGAGFIGSNFVRHALAKTDLSVVVLDKLTYAGNRASLSDLEGTPRFRLVVGDICDRVLLDRLFRDLQPRWVVNFAAESHVDRSIDGPRTFVETNILGAFELLDAARLHLSGSSADGRENFRLLHVSTDEVYGSLGSKGAFTEQSPYAPNSPYAATKAGADHLVRAYAETYGLPVLLTNCSNNYGPFQYPEKLIPLMMLNALEGRALPVYGDGLNVRDWLFVEDHCDALLAVLERGRPKEKYNIGGGCERTNLDLVDGLCAVLERLRPASANEALRSLGIDRYSSLKTFVPDRPGHDRRYAIDSSKIRAELGWQPKIDLATGLEITVHWYLTNERWCQSVQRDKYERQRLGLFAARAAGGLP